MQPHPYIRAYLAGIGVPSILLVASFTAFCFVRFGYHVSFPIERFMVFPLALVPPMWGLWNMLYVFTSPHPKLPVGVHGALLPLLVLPAAVIIAFRLGLGLPSFVPTVFALAMPVVVVFYYLLWTYAVGFLNELLGVGARR